MCTVTNSAVMCCLVFVRSGINFGVCRISRGSIMEPWAVIVRFAIFEYCRARIHKAFMGDASRGIAFIDGLLTDCVGRWISTAVSAVDVNVGAAL
jgi:hypothetical protein